MRDDRCLACADSNVFTAAELQGIGVSLNHVLMPEFMPPEGYNWYVMRATYNRAEKAVEMINDKLRYEVETTANELDVLTSDSASEPTPRRSLPVFAITPHETRRVFEGENRKYVKVACMPNMFFLLATREIAFEFTHRGKKDTAINYVDFAYDHTQKNEHGVDRVMKVPHRQMQNFLRVIEVDNPQAFVVSDSMCNFRPGGYVRIIHGIFEGAIGRVARIKNQTRVVVTIDNVLSYATSYIPKAYIEPISEEEYHQLTI